MLLCQHPSNQGQCRNLKCCYAAMGKSLASLAKDYYSCCHSAQRARPYALVALCISRQNMLWIFTTWTTKQELGSCKRTLQHCLLRVSQSTFGRQKCSSRPCTILLLHLDSLTRTVLAHLHLISPLWITTHTWGFSIPCCYSSYIRRRKWPFGEHASEHLAAISSLLSNKLLAKKKDLLLTSAAVKKWNFYLNQSLAALAEQRWEIQ